MDQPVARRLEPLPGRIAPRAPAGRAGNVSFVRAVRVALAVGGVGTVLFLFLVVGGSGYDTYSYWRVPHLGPSLYAGTESPNGLGPFRYAPAFAQLVSPLWVLPWDWFLPLWTVLCSAAYVFVARRWWLVGLGFAPVAFELFHGNIHQLMAAAIVVGFRYPAAWSFLLLTKVTPGVGLLWFAVRREWRSLAVAVAATAAVVLVSVVVGGVELWIEWARSLMQSKPATNTVFAWLPFPFRLILAGAIIAFGATRNLRWVVPIAVVLAIASPWLHTFSILIACLPLGILESARTSGWSDQRVVRWLFRTNSESAPASTVKAAPSVNHPVHGPTTMTPTAAATSSTMPQN
jgi:hypothetical protein